MKTNTRLWAGITAGILSLAGYASAATLGSEKYSYDASGNIIEKSIDGVVTKMAYDQANRLIGRQTAGQNKETTAYDAAGRPVTERNADGQTTRSMSYGYDDKVLESQTQDAKAGFYYNAEGQLLGKQTNGNVFTYAWDGNVLAVEGAEAFTNEAHISGGVPVLGAPMEVVVSDYIGSTLDVVGSPNTTQGGMSLWSRYGTDYGTDIGTGDDRSGRTCTTSIYNEGTVSKATWAFDMGVNFIPMRLKTAGGTEYWQWPSARGATSIQIHPEGEEYGTYGCVGIIGYANAESFRYFANGAGSFMEIFVEY